MTHSRFVPHGFALVIACLLLSTLPSTSADERAGDKKEKLGEWLKLPADGMPWMHSGTSIRLPQMLGQFRLHSLFKDIRPEAGISATYLRQDSNIKASVVIFPCSANLAAEQDIMALTRREHERLVADLADAGRHQGFVEKLRSPVREEPLGLWRVGEVPMTVQTIELVPADKARSAEGINHWLSLILFRDHFILLSVTLPSDQVQQSRREVDSLITQLLQCVREPSVVPEMIALCDHYMAGALTDEGRNAADTLLRMSKESPVFEVVLPGEALTPLLNEVSKISPEASLDLLRAFVVGSSASALNGNTIDQCLNSGSHLLLQLAEQMVKKDPRLELPFLKELSEAYRNNRAASFLKEKMHAAKKP